MANRKVCIICRLTVSGKSALAIEQALVNNGTIINVDSQQVYRDLPILTALLFLYRDWLLLFVLFGVFYYFYLFRRIA